MKNLLKAASILTVVAVAFGLGWLASSAGVGRAADPGSLSERERAFAQRMQNVVLAGHFTVEGEQRRDGLVDRYEIARVTKLDGDRWRFEVRITYLSVDVTLPVVVPIEWAGDTPMVSISDFSIPGLGEQFGARVLFDQDRYAGTWDHGEVGGLMYGTIQPFPSQHSPSQDRSEETRDP